MGYIVIAPLVGANGQDGKIKYLYQNAAVPEDVSDADIERLLGDKLIAKVGGSDEPTAAEKRVAAAKAKAEKDAADKAAAEAKAKAGS